HVQPRVTRRRRERPLRAGQHRGLVEPGRDVEQDLLGPAEQARVAHEERRHPPTISAVAAWARQAAAQEHPQYAEAVPRRELLALLAAAGAVLDRHLEDALAVL